MIEENTTVCKIGIDYSIWISAESRTYIHELYSIEMMCYPNGVAGDMRSLIASRVVLVRVGLTSHIKQICWLIGDCDIQVTHW